MLVLRASMGLEEEELHDKVLFDSTVRYLSVALLGIYC